MLLVYKALRHACTVLLVYDGAVRPAWVLELVEFTCFAGTKVQILTQEALHQVLI